LEQLIMMQHHTIAAGFVAVNGAATDAALAKAKMEIGEAGWKAGYTEERCRSTRAYLKTAGVPVVTKLSGLLVGVARAQTHDTAGNVYEKVRVTLANGAGDSVTTEVLSMDLPTEFCQRLLVKLEAAVLEFGPGVPVEIGAFAEVVRRDGRAYANHIAFVKDARGSEIKAVADHFTEAMSAAFAAEAALLAAKVKGKEALSAAKKSAKADYFGELAGKIEALFPARETGGLHEDLRPRAESHSS
jgi:hypothetical protein